MGIKEILNKVDHTELKQIAKWEDVQTLCNDGIKYQVASVCIPPSYVREVKEKYGDSIKICTVIGFPNGYNTTKVKVIETIDAVENGADEIDMVINIGWLKDKRYEEILHEIKEIKKASQGRLLKVIIETCLLTNEEKKKMCEIVSESGADYIKTSTGFSSGGATQEDIMLFKENVVEHVKIKAAGGIKSIDDAKEFIKNGAERLGTSRIVKEVMQNNISSN